jgi:hypothetical protein
MPARDPREVARRRNHATHRRGPSLRITLVAVPGVQGSPVGRRGTTSLVAGAPAWTGRRCRSAGVAGAAGSPVGHRWESLDESGGLSRIQDEQAGPRRLSTVASAERSVGRRPARPARPRPVRSPASMPGPLQFGRNSGRAVPLGSYRPILGPEDPADGRVEGGPWPWDQATS